MHDGSAYPTLVIVSQTPVGPRLAGVEPVELVKYCQESFPEATVCQEVGYRRV